ncbi:hypothetical protein E8E14_002943 [Neopestalotiopsis sp. 37M]|nr:hypothetical protein E8E14_002943 [Neopestalotiopsis sp. 37M]
MSDFSQYGTASEEWRKVSSSVPAPPPNLSLTEMREHVNREREQRSADEMKIWAPLVQKEDHNIPTQGGSSIKARSYRPANACATPRLPVLLYLHGGGFLTGTIASEDAHTYPTAWNDTHDAFEWLHDHIDDLDGNCQQVIIGGISSGAYLAASFVLEKHLGRLSVSRPSIAGQILMVPCLLNASCHEPMIKKFKDPATCSLQQNCNAPLLPLSIFQILASLLQISNPSEDDLRLNPGYVSTSQARGLPPTIVAVSGQDFLRDEGLLYAKTLHEAGIPTDVHVFPGLPHAFATIPGLDKAKQRWDTILDGAVAWVLSKPSNEGNFTIQTE